MAPIPSELSTVPLDRLLAKLDQTILSPSSNDQLLRSSPYERNKVGANIDYAQSLLLALERQSATIRIQSQRQQLQADLTQKRALIKSLTSRLEELKQAAVDDEDSESEDEDENGGEDSEQADRLAQYGPARKDTNSGLDAGEPQEARIDTTQAEELRSRKPLQASDNRSAASTTAREQLFADRSKPAAPTSDLQRTEVLMSHNRTEQETLTTGLLSLAQALKQSSLQFSSSLEAEKDVMNRATGGLDKNAQGMEAAEKRMGMLRRMSEGQGWWGRIKLYAFIFGLWVACFLLVFVGPKLRF